MSSESSNSIGIKRKKYNQKYKKEWELRPEFAGWLQANKANPNFAYCQCCNKDINISSGFDALNKHASTEVHRKRAESFAVPPIITSFVSQEVTKFSHQVKEDNTMYKQELEIKIKNPGDYLEYTKYSKKLEETPELKSWILPNESDPYTAKCKYCVGSILRADRNILLKHTNTKKHLRNSNLTVKCRTCLINSHRDNIRSVFSVDETTNLAYSDILLCITGVQINLENDDLPTGMCSDCRKFSVKAYNFQMQVKRADALLHKGVKTENNHDDDDDYDMTADAAFLDYEQLEWEPESGGDNLKLAKSGKRKIEQKSNQCCLCNDSFDSSVALLKHVQTAHPKVVKGTSRRTEGTIGTKKLRKRLIQVPSTVLSSVTGARANGLRSCSIPIVGVLDLSEASKKTSLLEHRCGVCGDLFKDEAQLDEHCRGHASSDVLMCSLCEKVYFKYCHFKRHFGVHHPDLETVNQTDNTEALLDLQDTEAMKTILQYIRMTTIGDIIHANIEPSEQPVEIEAYVQVCGLCGCVILSPEDLQLHNQTEHPDLDTRCYYCAKTYTDKVSLKYHKKICRTREKRFECVTCGMRFHTESELVKHMSKGHTNTFDRWTEYKKRSPRHICTKCNNTFPLENQLKKHKMTCNPETVFICDFCSKVFTQRFYLQRHLRYMHDGNKNKHLCSICGKGFPVTHQMIVHMRTHTRDFPYRCTLCPKEFATAHQFKYHRRWHSGDTPHMCKICSKRFIRAVSLRNHMLIHTGERPFNCDMCNVAFRQPYDLVKHKAKIHGTYHKGILRTADEPIDTNSPIASKKVKAETGLEAPSAASARAANAPVAQVYTHKEKHKKPTPKGRSLPTL